VVRLVISIILLIALCVLVVMNVNYKTSINLFWKTFDQVSVVAIALVSFVFGVVYSFFLYAARYLDGRRRSALLARGQDLERREKEALAKESEALQTVTERPAADQGAAVAQDAAAPQRKRRGLLRR
jgi:uncharacterized integral membrane protein